MKNSDEASKKISVFMIEDHDLTRIGLTAALSQFKEIEIIGEAAKGKEGVEKIRELNPDVCIIDLGLPDIDGIEVTQQLKQDENFDSSILILTMNNDENSVLAAFTSGADSYCLKDIEIELLIEAIHLTYEGSAWIDPAIAKTVLKNFKTLNGDNSVNGKVPEEQKVLASENQEESKPENYQFIKPLDPEQLQILETYPLTDRELEVLELIVAGSKNADIAGKLFLTVGTVKTHVRNILNKLCVNDRTQAAVTALRSGLVH